MPNILPTHDRMGYTFDQPPPETPPELLHHYTDQRGLLGILSDKRLWFTDIACVNDSAEFRYVEELFGEMIEQLKRDESVSQRLRRYVSLTESTVNGFFKLGAVPENFVASFSESADDLALWRGYSSTGSRYMISFRSAALQRLVPFGVVWRMRRVRYDVRDHVIKSMREAFVSYIKEKVADALNKAELELSESEQFEYESNPMQHVDARRWIHWLYAGAYKHPAFAHEVEWRMVFNDLVTSDFRIGKSFIVPYTAMSLTDTRGLVDSVVVGPGPNPDVACASVRALLMRRGWVRSDQGEVTVKASEIPYRDW